MNQDPRSGKLFEREQFRMARLQVFNWGTFAELHDIPISERGFLIVGPSGAGKSTLLDAFSALLVPPRWIDFNAAAREADRTGRDRNLVTYIRGAWSAQNDAASGEFAMRYLRTGTTWSAIALHYQNALGQHVVLVQLFWLRGNANGNSDVRRHYLIFERPFDLRQLGDFGNNNFDIRKLKAAFPEAHSRDEFRPYCERFCRLLGIENEMALRLLHKTQSAKNLGDLNTFLRDFMLDRPETFDVAERLVNEFGELNAAHQAVVTAREQVGVLVPARQRYDDMRAIQMRRNGAEELRAGMNSYRELRRIALLTDAIAALEIEAEGLQGKLQRQQDALDNRSAALRDLRHQSLQAGGDQIEHWENEKSGLEQQRKERMRRREQALGACAALDWILPAAPADFAALQGLARVEINEWTSVAGSHEQLLVLDRLKTESTATQRGLLTEIASLRRQPSNIPAPMLDLRREIAGAIGVAEAALPFVAELVEVKAEESAWRGAAERVLRGFAMSILVDDEHYGALANHINGINLGQRLVYNRMTRPESTITRPVRASSLVLKLNVKDCANTAWLQATLRQHFDYDCVDSIKAFRAASERALTREGQVKHSRSRHEKDDRKSVDLRRHWLLGFDNREKLALYEQDAHTLQLKIDDLDTQIAILSKQQALRGARVLQCQTLANLQFQEIDAQPLVQRMNAIERSLTAARDGNSALKRIETLLKQQEDLVLDAEKALRKIGVDHETCRRHLVQHEEKRAACRADPSLVALTPFQREGLDARYSALPDAVELDTLDKADRAVSKSLGADIENFNHEAAVCEKFVEAQFAHFIGRWRGDADGLDASLGAATDFFAKLSRLEVDGLPAHEQRFFDLLQNQSNQNLAALSTYLNNARKAILERMELVNESLRQVPFNQSLDQTTFLHIEPSDRQLPEVREFKQDIQRILSHAWTEDAEFAEERFLALRKLVDRLASQEPELRRWREAVLDVRMHVEFVGRELDTEGVQVDVYQSGAGKSGGQRQKLTTTCLAAALRYQLGGTDHGVPMYAAVVLDEAFDKADNEFTALAMNIFANFGFQMIVATPLKSVMTLEPFIGGACFVAIRERRVSGVLMIEYDDTRQRLKLPDHTRTEAVLEAAK
ncbi:MAG: ATP-binding protein [Pseudomonadota bacterium]